MEAGIRDLRKQFSAYLRRVKAGETIIITERGEPVGRIVPIKQSLESQIAALQQAGLLAWNGEKLPPFTPLAQVDAPQTVAEMLLEDRE
jgi:prevent-host-death family protein